MQPKLTIAAFMSLLAVICGAASAQQGSAPRDARQTVEGVFAAFNRHDAAALARFYASDVTLTSSEYCNPLHGRDAVQQNYAQLFAAVPDIEDELTDVFVDGDKVAVRFVSRSHAPEHVFEMALADFFVVRNGLIVRDDTIFNVERACR